MGWAEEGPAWLGRREDSKLEVVGPAWIGGRFGGIERDLPTLEFDKLMADTIHDKCFDPSNNENERLSSRLVDSDTGVALADRGVLALANFLTGAQMESGNADAV